MDPRSRPASVWRSGLAVCLAPFSEVCAASADYRCDVKQACAAEREVATAGGPDVPRTMSVRECVSHSVVNIPGQYCYSTT